MHKLKAENQSNFYMDWQLGTMGFAFKDWEGVFYPDAFPNQKYLHFYSEQFTSVEIDSTFYGTPRQSTVLRWHAITPDNFTVSLKMPRRITHELKLINTDNDVQDFLAVSSLLEDKLGVILIQFPASFSADDFDVLQSFLEKLPQGLRFAIEFRHPSWYTVARDSLTPRVADNLQAQGICWTAIDYPGVPSTIYPTADFLYIRWIGQHGRYSEFKREHEDLTPQLEWWRQQIISNKTHIKNVFGYFNNDFAGFAPKTCNRFKQLVGLPISQFELPRQGVLFD